jgi:cobalt/nickel transport system permease protein
LHLPDGIIPLWQTVIYWILTLIFLSLYLYKLTREKKREKMIINTAVFAAATIVVSSLSIPSPFGVPIHFFLIPLAAILLGPLTAVTVAFLCFTVQFLFLGMGGLTTLGVNTVTMGIVMSFSTYIFYKLTLDLDEKLSIFSGTFMGIILATVAQILILIFAGVATLEMLLTTLIPFYLLVAVIEGVANVFVMNLISKIKPEMLKLDKI